MTLHELQRRNKSFNIQEEILDVIRATAQDIIKYNQEQIFSGKLKTGEPIQNLKTGYVEPYAYSVWWGETRLDKGLQVDHYDFKVTGEWYASMAIIDVNTEGFTITSEGQSQKFETLLFLFGPDFMGLAPEKRVEYTRQVFFPELKRRIEQKTGMLLT